jgi:uncharacterized protein YbcC (UPF0753/DUF2309 family)
MPKPLKKLGFMVEMIPNIPEKKQQDVNKDEQPVKKEVLSNHDYVPSDNVTRWIEKFGACSDVLEEAKSRESELCNMLKKVDNDLLDVLHIIEIESPKDLYHGWLLYKRIKTIRRERRDIKDELTIVRNILRENNSYSFNRKTVKKAIDGLSKRKYTFRITETENIEEGDSVNDM